jgi:hypothetical protein
MSFDTTTSLPFIAESSDFVACNGFGLEVACAREPVAYLELRGVPLRGSLLLLLFGFFLFASLLKNVLDIVEGNAFNGPVIYLSKLVVACC